MPAIHTATFDAVFIKATDVATVAADKIDGVKDLSIDDSRSMTELAYIGDDLAVSVPGVRSMSFSLSGHVMSGDAPQSVLRDAYEDGTLVFLTLITDPGAAAGSQGKRYGVYVESYNEKMTQGDVISFDVSFSLGSKTITAV